MSSPPCCINSLERVTGMCSNSIHGFKIHSLNTLSNAFKWQRGWKPISFVWSDPVLLLRHRVYFSISSTSQDRLVWRPLTHAGTLGATYSSSTCITHHSSRIITTQASHLPPLSLFHFHLGSSPITLIWIATDMSSNLLVYKLLSIERAIYMKRIYTNLNLKYKLDSVRPLPETLTIYNT